MNSEEVEEELYKTIVIGNTGVGKTTLLVRFQEDKFLGPSSPTVGIDIQTKDVEYSSVKFKLELWDTAGQERFRTIVKNFFNRSKAAVIVFDISDENSYEEIHYWLEELTQRCGPELPKIVVGNKTDKLAPADLNTTLEALERVLQPLRAQYNFQFETVSGLTGENTKKLFDRITELVFKRYLQGKTKSKKNRSSIIGPVDPKERPNRCC